MMRPFHHTVRLTIAGALFFASVDVAWAQSPSLQYPATRRADQTDDYHGTRVADRRHATRLRGFDERIGLAGVSSARGAERAGPRGHAPLDQILEHRLDEGQSRLLLFALRDAGGRRATLRRDARDGESRPEGLLPSGRHAAGNGSIDSRAAQQSRLAVPDRGERRRPVRRHHDLSRVGRADAALLRRPGPFATTVR